SDHEDPSAPEGPEASDEPGETTFSEAPLAARALRPCQPADVDRHVEQADEPPIDARRHIRCATQATHLSQHLVLADDRALEAGREPQEVTSGLRAHELAHASGRR